MKEYNMTIRYFTKVQ